MDEQKTLDPVVLEAVQVRLGRLRAAMAQQGLDAAIVSHEKDIFYLTGSVGHDALLWVTADEATIFCDARYDEYLEPWRAASATNVVMGTRHRLADAVHAHAGPSAKRIGTQAEYLTLVARGTIADALGAERLVDTRALVGTLRMKKDALEVAHIERAASIQLDALSATLDDLVIGMTERELCARLEFEMKRRGADGPSFGTIIGSGPNSALPHHLTGDTPIAPGVLLIDWGALRDGYASDMTRTYGVESMPPKIAEIYDIVLEAQMAAIDAATPGKTCASIDAVARDIITAAGYGEQFGHGLGHGLGIDVHESPYFNDLSTDILLEPGMVMTVEPGIYLPGVGGVRIEDDILITDSGARILGPYPKQREDAIITPALAETEA